MAVGGMMSQSLYRKYRSQTFDELVGQEHVKKTLINAIKSGKIAHAYLFCGPRGTGKTSTARLLAKAVNCLSEGTKPCNSCSACLSINEGRAVDLIEIDAASRRKVEDVADIIERVNFAPAELRYKVYIIDEVHMLTTHAFNALLKTLEEPPAHAIFVLATTEVWKVLPTIISRCQRFDFRRITPREIVERLAFIAENENIKIQKDALIAIAKASTGSLRDAISILDQLTVYGDEEITLEHVKQLLGIVGEDVVANFVGAIIDNDTQAALSLLTQLSEHGVDPRQFTQELVSYLRDLMLLKAYNQNASKAGIERVSLQAISDQASRVSIGRLHEITEKFSTLDYTIRTGPYGYLPLELAAVALTNKDSQPYERAENQRQQPNPAHTNSKSVIHRVEEVAEDVKDAISDIVAKVTSKNDAALSEAQPSQNEPITLDRVQANWQRILDRLRASSLKVQALLKAGRPVAVEDGNTLVIEFQFDFHKKSIEEPSNRELVESTLQKVLGGTWKIQCILSSEQSDLNPTDTRTEREKLSSDPRVRAAVQIFNGRIVEINGGES